MDAKKLGKKIKLARIELDLTQTQLAQRINSKQKSISRYETGASLPSIKTLIKIAKVLKKPADYFLDQQGEDGDLTGLKEDVLPIPLLYIAIKGSRQRSLDPSTDRVFILRVNDGTLYHNTWYEKGRK